MSFKAMVRPLARSTRPTWRWRGRWPSSRRRNREPSFQYIVTTTTPPPRALAADPFVRLTLDARNEEGLLLKHSIHVGVT